VNASHVEEYVSSRGAFHINHRIIKMEVQNVKQTTRVDDNSMVSFVDSPFPNQYIDPRLLQGRSRTQEVIPNRRTTSSKNYGGIAVNQTGLSDSAVGNQSASTAASVPDFPRFFSFNSLLEEGHGNSLITPVTDTSFKNSEIVVGSQIVTIKVPLFLRALSQSSLCLGSGPGYLRSAIDQALTCSIL
jgi:hypothetical protein